MVKKEKKQKDNILPMLPKACSDEPAAVEFLENMRWGDTPMCPHCESQNVYKMVDRSTGKRNKRFLWRCNDCKKQYTVRIGTVFEDSRIPLRNWCYGFWAACASKKGVSALQIQRMTGIAYKSALFMMHRIRYAMGDNVETPQKLNGIVEVDETYIGGKPRHKKFGERGKSREKGIVFGMLQRGGDVRAMQIPKATAAELRKNMLGCIETDSRLMTDQARIYKNIGKPFKSHEAVMHSLMEYVRGDVTTNSIEGFFSLLKRGFYGTFHNVSNKHLHRYVGEFAFRYNTRKDCDGARVVRAIKNSEGKRLTYKEQIS